MESLMRQRHTTFTGIGSGMTYQPSYVVGIHGPARSGKGVCAKFLLNRGGWQQIDLADHLRRKIAAALGSSVVTAFQRQAFQGTLKKLVWEDDAKGWDTGCHDYVRCAATLGEDVGADIACDFTEWLKGDVRTVRQIMQRTGTEVYRAKDPDYWLKVWCEYTDAVRVRGSVYDRRTGGFYPGDSANSVVCSDVRFPNEAKYIRGIANYGQGARRGFVVKLNAPWAEPPKEGLANHVSNATLPDEYVDAVVNVAEPPWKKYPDPQARPMLFDSWAGKLRSDFGQAVDDLIKENP